MIVHKKISTEIIKIELLKVKNYTNYDLYQVFKIENNIRIPLYKECYSNIQMREIVRNRNIIEDEVCL